MSKPKFVYVTYITTTPEKLWQALTDPEFIRRFWFGVKAECDWKAGIAVAHHASGWPRRRYRRNPGIRSAASVW